MMVSLTASSNAFRFFLRFGKLELKAVPYDTISKEALTNAIPGYLRQILVAVGGPDIVYDYRSRSFKTKERIRREFRDASAGGGQLWSASDHVRSKIGTSRFNQMSYDLMINDLSGKTSHGRGRRQVAHMGYGVRFSFFDSPVLNTLIPSFSLRKI